MNAYNAESLSGARFGVKGLLQVIWKQGAGGDGCMRVNWYAKVVIGQKYFGGRCAQGRSEASPETPRLRAKWEYWPHVTRSPVRARLASPEQEKTVVRAA